MNEESQKEKTVWRMQEKFPDGTIVKHKGEGLFDELLVSGLLHLEWLHDQSWNLQIGDAQITASILTDGRVEVNVLRGSYNDQCGECKTWEQHLKEQESKPTSQP